MRTPTRIPSLPPNPYEELASLADPEPEPTPPDTPPGAPPLTVHIAPAHVVADEPWSPPDHRRPRKRSRRTRRTRRSPARRPRLLVPRLLAAALGATALLLLADRCAAMYAEKKAQQALRQQLHLAADPQVDIRGFPFLTQVLAKRLHRVDVTVPDVDADRVSLAKVRASARDVRITGSVPAGVRGATVGQLKGDVLLSFADMNRELGSSQIKFSDLGDDAVAARGRVGIAGQQVLLRARAHLRRDGDRAVSTEVDSMSLDLPHLATYRPEGKDKSLVLHREAAERISRDAGRAKALLAVPAIAARLGVTEEEAAAALHSEQRLRGIVGSPRFVDRLTRANLVDVVVAHPWILERLGVDPAVVAGLAHVRPPELADRLTLSFRLPPQAKDLHLRGVVVERDGIRADLSATGLSVGGP
ncbi:DUF2993 domain-containing protein [Streptomyces cinnamoneus]|uniref:DUF2993 domain-containing protein n=1 Tax=Streptomyces cinnamoneus TaxID=53446 RepID=UPI0037B213A8